MSSQGPSTTPLASSPPDFHEADIREHEGNAASRVVVLTPAEARRRADVADSDPVYDAALGCDDSVAGQQVREAQREKAYEDLKASGGIKELQDAAAGRGSGMPITGMPPHTQDHVAAAGAPSSGPVSAPADGAPPRNQAENRPARHSFDKGRLTRETADIEAGHATAAEVKNVQRELNHEGAHLRVDGIAGKNTRGAIKLKRSGLLPKP